jgi:hypothetical protein
LEATNFTSSSIGVDPTMSMGDGGKEEPITTRAYNSSHRVRAKPHTFVGVPTKPVDSQNLTDGEAVFSLTIQGIKN